MKTRNTHSLGQLQVLSLLAKGPSHQYALQLKLGFISGMVQHTLERLASRGFIKRLKPKLVGCRLIVPNQITAAGRAHLKEETIQLGKVLAGLQRVK